MVRFLEFLPGLKALLQYRREDWPDDLRAGLTVAAVALPISFANAQIAGFSPIVGLYSFLLPMAVYVLLGTSRHLIIGPDAATAALVASAITPLAQGNQDLYLTLSIVLAMMVGVICIAASFLRLGGIADFLSRPILIGFLHGIAIAIIIDQIPTILGFQKESDDVIPALMEIAKRIGQSNVWSIGVSVFAAVVLILISRRYPKVPAALITMVASGALVAIFGLQHRGVMTIGSMQAGLPHLRFDIFHPQLIRQLLGVAGGVAVVSYAGVILDARIFASKNRYEIDADREFAALGFSQIASAVSQGFCVGSLDSGAAMVDLAKGRTQMTGVVAIAAVGLIISLFTPLLSFVPNAALAIIVLSAAWAMTDIDYLRSLYRMSLSEFVVAIVALLGVITLGAVNAILLAVVLALLRFVRLTSRPSVEILGKVSGTSGYHSIQRNPTARTPPGMLFFRFNAPVVFFNAPYFRKKVLDCIAEAEPGLRWFVVDAFPLSQIDVTGWHTISELMDELRERKIRLVIAGRRTEVREYALTAGISVERIERHLFPTLGAAESYYREQKMGEMPDRVAQ
jgi:high affinity sulfate transporter 1